MAGHSWAQLLPTQGLMLQTAAAQARLAQLVARALAGDLEGHLAIEAEQKADPAELARRARTLAAVALATATLEVAASTLERLEAALHDAGADDSPAPGAEAATPDAD